MQGEDRFANAFSFRDYLTKRHLVWRKRSTR